MRTVLVCARITLAFAVLFLTLARAEAALQNASAGQVSFSNSGAAAAQEDFLYGLAQLHNFEYVAAAIAFRRAQQIDPGFAMAYWGEAMTHNHPVWFQQDLAAARAVLEKLGAVPQARLARAGTEREKAYLRSLDVLYGEGSKHDRDRRYALAMEALHEDYPNDVDATCFYALALLGTADAGRDIPTYMRSAAIMEEVFERNPQHPGAAHYLIHSVDDAVHAPLGLRAARAYARVAPEAAHAQHMTSHIFLAMGMWEETVQANETAVAVSTRARKARNPNALPAACSHGIIWLSYAYVQLGRLADARKLIDACAQEAQVRPFLDRTSADQLDVDGSSVAALAAMRARYLLDSGDRQGTVAAMPASPNALPRAEFTWDLTDAYLALRTGTLAAAEQGMQRAQRSGARMKSAIEEAGIAAEHPMRQLPQMQLDQLGALLALRRGATVDALAQLNKVAMQERSLQMDFGPPAMVKPANELLGEVLLDLKRPAEARRALEAAQVIGPGRVQVLQGLAACADALGDQELLRSVTGKLRAIRKDAMAAGSGSPSTTH